MLPKIYSVNFQSLPVGFQNQHADYCHNLMDDSSPLLFRFKGFPKRLNQLPTSALMLSHQPTHLNFVSQRHILGGKFTVLASVRAIEICLS